MKNKRWTGTRPLVVGEYDEDTGKPVGPVFIIQPGDVIPDEAYELLGKPDALPVPRFGKVDGNGLSEDELEVMIRRARLSEVKQHDG